jgi:hypothetical protein
MLQCAIEQIQVKEARKKEEDRMENEFKKKLMDKFAADEKLEQYNVIKRKQKELDFKKEIERQWQDKLRQFHLQREQELNELKVRKKEEISKRELIEKEKERLLRENEEILRSYYSKGYQKSLSSLNSK